MKYVLAVILVIIMITILACTKRDSGARTAGPLDREEIITAAKEYFARTSSLLDMAKVFYDEDNTIWKKDGAQFIDVYPGEAHKVELLEGLDYQLVCFFPQEDAMWLDLSGVFVFVDRNSGNVITSLWGKYSSRNSDTSADK